MSSIEILFYFLGFLTIFSSLCVVFAVNPIYSALSLVVSMISVAFLFIILNSNFVAAVQLIVYAGAVVVLFVMVLMLFDLKKEIFSFHERKITTMVKVLTVGLLTGLIAASFSWTFDIMETEADLSKSAVIAESVKEISTQNIATSLFTKYLFGFEAISILLLIVVVGAVALARSEGGTHES